MICDEYLEMLFEAHAFKDPHSRSVKTEGYPSGLQKLTVHGDIFGLSGGLSVSLARIRRCLIFWEGFKRTERKLN